MDGVVSVFWAVYLNNRPIMGIVDRSPENLRGVDLRDFEKDPPNIDFFDGYLPKIARFEADLFVVQFQRIKSLPHNIDDPVFFFQCPPDQ